MKISVIGSTGRMGRTVLQEAINDSNLEIAAGLVEPGDNFVNFDLGEIAGKYNIGVNSSTNLEEVVKAGDAVIDFSAPTVTLATAKLAAANRKILVSGTTGFTNEELEELRSYAKDTVIVHSPNMSIGVNVTEMIVEKLSRILGDDYDTEIIEMHHRYKKDAPSGTALLLGQAVARGKNLDFDKYAVKSREGIVGERATNEIGFATLRGGSVVGDHTVMFAGDNDRIEITHKAVNRNIFARGALHAAKWAKDKEPGFYNLKDIISLD